MKGLARICKDGVDSICGGVRELEAQRLCDPGACPGRERAAWGPLSTPSWSSLKSLRLYGKNLYGKIPYRQIQTLDAPVQGRTRTIKYRRIK